MKKTWAAILITWVTAEPFQDTRTPQIWSGRLSDSMCGASHHAKATAGNMSERECIFECIKGLAIVEWLAAADGGRPRDQVHRWHQGEARRLKIPHQRQLTIPRGKLA